MCKEYTAVSLFAGAGGLDMGFHNAGIKTLWANDFDHDACETHRAWSGAEVVEGDIAKVDFDLIPDSDIILGGFPCQGFSLAGPRKVDDSRNSLYRHYVKLVDLKRPRVFVADNVKGILTLGGGEIIKAIVDEFADKGYRVTYHLLNAKDYGVPQDRQRVIIVGIRDDEPGVFTLPDKCDPVTMRDALASLPEPEPDEICDASYSSRYMSRNRKRQWDQQSYTIPAMAKQCPLWPGSPDMHKISTDLWEFGDGLTRRLSYKEAAAIQTFPADMYFHGDLTSKYKQIGNAVPVRLAEKVDGQIIKVLEDEK